MLETDALERFFDALYLLNADQLRCMRAVWQELGSQAHEDSWAAVRAIGESEGLSKEIDRVRDRAVAWASRGNNSTPYVVTCDVAWLQVKLDAEEAIVDAALAVALGDRIDAKTCMTLLAPWRRATEASR